MDPHHFGRHSSSIDVRKITHKSSLGENIWLLGTVVRARRVFPDEESADAKGSSSSKSPAKGKSGKKGNRKDKAKDKKKESTLNYEVLILDTEPYFTLVCHQCCSTSEWGILSETCRSGLRKSRSFLLRSLVEERSRHRALAPDLQCLLKHFNVATEVFQENDDEGHGIAGFEFKTSAEAYDFLRDVIDFQRRHGDAVRSGLR